MNKEPFEEDNDGVNAEKNSFCFSKPFSAESCDPIKANSSTYTIEGVKPREHLS